MHKLLRLRHYDTLAEVLQATVQHSERDPDLLAELQSERLERAESEAFTPFPA